VERRGRGGGGGEGLWGMVNGADLGAKTVSHRFLSGGRLATLTRWDNAPPSQRDCALHARVTVSSGTVSR